MFRSTAPGLITTLCLTALVAGCQDRPPQSRAAVGSSQQGEAKLIAFDDIAADVGLDFEYWNGMTGELYFPEVFGAGGALFDYDRDGDLDVYLVQGTQLVEDGQAAPLFPPPEQAGDRLFRNELVPTGVLQFRDVTDAAGIAVSEYGMGVASADYDNDGWPDLYVTALGSNHLLRNLGDGRFLDVTSGAGVDVTSWSVPAVFFDYDRDGALDLFVGNYVEFNLGVHRTCPNEAGVPDYCGPTNFVPLSNHLFRNLGNGTFEDVTEAVGLGNSVGNTLGAVAADLDGDGWLDLYVANDWMPNRLWVNRSGELFDDLSIASGSALSGQGIAEASMGVEAADLDADGDLDLIVSHLRRETNTVYRNLGDSFFADVSIETGLGPPSWNSTGFGLAVFDYDLDGALDVFVANGEIKRLEGRPASDLYPLAQTDQLWRGVGSVFEEVSPFAEALEPRVGRGVAVGDLDNDGRLDLLVVNNSGPVRLLRNVSTDGSWVGLSILDRAGRDALDARVTLRLDDGRSLIRDVSTDGSYASANDPRVHFGLGAAQIEAVEVRWPTGGRELFPAPPLDVYSVLNEGAGSPLEGSP